MDSTKTPEDFYVGIPVGGGSYVYFRNRQVMEAVNDALQPVLQRVIDTSTTPEHVIRRAAKLRNRQFMARIHESAFKALIAGGTGVTRDQAVALGSHVVDWKI
jgi:hypothetical protein